MTTRPLILLEKLQKFRLIQLKPVVLSLLLGILLPCS